MSLNTREKVKKWIISNLNDPLAKTLLKNSHLTEIQAETLLIDVYSERLYDEKISFTEKAALRTSTKNISRGSFNRTLKQARVNMIKSVWTVLLLGYLGLLETPSLSPYIEASNKLESYMKEYYSLRKTIDKDLNDEKIDEITTDLKNNIKNELNNVFNGILER